MCVCRYVRSLLRGRHDLLHCNYLLRQLQGRRCVCTVYFMYVCMYICMYVYMIEVIDTVLRVVIDLFTSYLVDVYTHTDSVVLSRAYHVCMYV